jgi:hypothetical protein
MLMTIDKIFERIKVREQYHNSICVALRQCLANAELNIILHDEIGHDVDRLLLETWTIYNMPTSYDTEPMKMSITTKRKKRHGRVKTTIKQRAANRTRSS